jgi:hypothetical protein
MNDLSMFSSAAPAATPYSFKAILEAALAAGAAAHRTAVPEPMTVIGGDKSYYVSEGMCGFSWVKIKGNNGFGAYCKKAGIARPAYGGGLRISYPFPSQSYDRGQAWANAFADVLKDNGIFAYADGNLD